MPKRHPGSLKADDIAKQTLEQIINNVFETSDRDSDETNHVITEREFEIQTSDFSLMERDNTNNTESQTTFDPNFTLRRSPVDMSVGPTAPGPSNNAIDREIQQLQNSLVANPDENLSLRDLIREVRQLQIRVDETAAYARAPQNNTNRRLSFHEHAFNATHDQNAHDIRNQRESTVNFLPLKDARKMIPEIDGTNRNRVKEFLNASTYAIKNIHPAEEHTLLEAIICTKFKDKAMTDFQTREIRNFEQLKKELEHEYLGKRSTAHLQIEFYSLKQRHNESAQDFGRRAEQLAMELFESMEEGKDHTAEQRQAVLENIKEQALYIYQTGLHEDIKLLVRAQRYTSLTEAITGAIAEEKVKGVDNRNSTSRGERENEQQKHPHRASQCQNCGKTGHYEQDCRSSKHVNRFMLLKHEGRPDVHTIDKYCNHCRRKGHTRQECWSLNGRPNREETSSRSNGKMRENNMGGQQKERRAIKATDSQSSDDEDEEKYEYTPTELNDL